MLQKIRFFTKKIQNYRYRNYCPGWQEFKSIHMIFFTLQVVLVTSAWDLTRSTSLSSLQRSNWSPTYILHLFHLEDTSLLFLFISEFVKVRFLPRVVNYRYRNYCPGWQEFKSIHMIFYVNPSWACALFISNKQHVEESGLWRIQTFIKLTKIGAISLTFKKMYPLSLDNYRPITLLNTDAKLLAYTIAQRLKEVLPSIIHSED
jgi:hypothetical protein